MELLTPTLFDHDLWTSLIKTINTYVTAPTDQPNEVVLVLLKLNYGLVQLLFENGWNKKTAVDRKATETMF